MTEDAPTAVESESFSPQSAHEALSEVMDAMPKSRRMEFFGHFNEIAVVLTKLEQRAGIAKSEHHKSL